MPKPSVTCCTPESHHTPSGWGWFHASDCQTHTGAKIETATKPTDRRLVVVGGRDWGTSTEDVPTRLDPTAAHPACIAAAADGATPCSRCSWLLDLDDSGARYVDHWADNR
jgi:hypothetical protein